LYLAIADKERKVNYNMPLTATEEPDSGEPEVLPIKLVGS